MQREHDAIVDCAVYLDGRRLDGCTDPESAKSTVDQDERGFVWIGMHNPDEQQMHALAATFDLHPLAVEDAVHAHQRPKVERYDDTLVLVLKTVHFVPHESIANAREIVETGEIMVFVAPTFVITVRHGDFSGLAGLRHELEATPERLLLGSYAVLHAIADHVVDHYLDVVLLVESDIDTVEVQVFSHHGTDDIQHIYFLKRELVEFRRAVSPLSIALQRLVSDHKDLIASKEIRRYLRDVVDHQTTASERIAAADEVLSSLVHVASARIAMQQNTDLRKISAFVAIAAVPTAVAGIYGMNFDHMPELRHAWGYPAVLLLILILCTSLYVIFRRKRWL